MTREFALSEDRLGRLKLRWPDGSTISGVIAVRPFPISAPEQGVSLLDSDGHEIVAIDALDSLGPENRALIEEQLRRREFMPRILSLQSVSSFITPSSWSVITDRGPTTFILAGEEFIRRLPGGDLLISDALGLHYLVREPKRLDRASRKLLDRFL